ncbi:FISUMP domain-containing protein [Riemerella anatipestifer]|nr:FISUMP domain-containing protein [Riemerella anatipestifer]MDY3324710.1 FISUMP domain-containing protein [Riemerella anatipestifer]MDY3353520.1 FISUMP domain-containing protein [Riemerella anatipestifer]
MKKTLFCAMFLPLALQAQVGINTNDPKATLEVKKNTHIPNTQPQGVLFPRFTSEERLKFSGTAEVGTMIYNTDKSCIEIYQGVVSGVHQWTCMPGSNQTQSVAVKAAGFEGSYVGAVPFTNANKAKFKLENNSFGNISSAFHDAVSFQNGSATITMANCQWQKLNGSMLTGSVNPCTSGNLINLNSGESAMLWYTMGGTPETGTLKANFNKLGAQADQQTQVGLGSATITSPKTEYVVSLTYNSTNIQGQITNGMTVKIPYTGGSGSYNAAVATPTTTAPGQGGDMNTISLSIPSGNFLVSGDLVATLTVDGDGVYNVTKKAPGEQYDIAIIPYSINGTNYELKLVGIGGVPDRCFGKTTQQCLSDMGSPSPWASTEMEHQFIYIPITGPDGKTWLNNNLGAEYARVGSLDFNPTKQATSKTDYKAYGSLFQWQRKPDGHELITWTSSTNGTPKYTGSGSLSSSWTNAGTNRFINGEDTYASWLNTTVNQQTANHQLWRANGTNNPCPLGYHVPTLAELQALHTAITGATGTNSSGNSNMWNETGLRLPASGGRIWVVGSFGDRSSHGRFWSSEASNSSHSWSLWFSSRNSGAGYNDYRAFGFSVRCIKDN